MVSITHDLTIRTAPEIVFAGVSSPKGLDAWWTKSCKGALKLGAEYQLGFGEGLAWRAVVKEAIDGRRFVLKMTDAAADWVGTIVRFEIEDADNAAILRFEHAGWSEQSAHFRRSSYCWAMYLRLLRIYCESGATTPYAERYFA